MTDAFALLDEPRQPWLEVEALKTKFLSRSAATHPDKFQDPTEKAAAQTRFADLNSAHETLRDPKRRLQHLLTLESGRKLADWSLPNNSSQVNSFFTASSTPVLCVSLMVAVWDPTDPCAESWPQPGVDSATPRQCHNPRPHRAIG